MRRLLRSAAFRIALASAAASLFTTGLVFALVAWRFHESDVATVERILQNEVAAGLAEPLGAIRRQLELRLTQDLRHLDYVGLVGADGSPLFGNLPSGLRFPEDGKPHVAAPSELPRADAANGEVVFVARRRSDGILLVLGRSLATIDELEDAMRTGFSAALVPMTLLALVAGTLYSRRAFRRLADVQAAIDKVMAGDLASRLPTRGGPDDVDTLTRSVNLMLDEVDRLVAQITSVGDNMAHDLRAPLAAMRARLERGLAGSEASLRDAAASAVRDLDRSMATVTAILRISSLEGGRRRGAFSQVDLREVCADACDLFLPLAEAKGIGMSLDAPSPVIVRGDGDLLREALANLIDNAVKYTPSGGRIAVRCHDDHGTLVTVGDTGPGVAPAERHAIFKRSYRAQPAAATPGNGLGLSMAATIADLHGFDLRVEDNAPGALFVIARSGAARRRS